MDFLRSLAAFCVVLNHGVEFIYHLNLEYISLLDVGEKIICFSAFTIGRTGVPVFLLLSGYLLLDREYNSERILKFYKNNLIPMLITWEIWVIIYNFFLMWFRHVPFDWGMLFRNMLFIQSVELSHTWYMPMIIGMYLFLPYVSIVLHLINERFFLLVMFIMFGYLFIIPSVNLFREGRGFPQFTGLLDLSYSGNVYGLYLLLGYCIKRWEKKIDKVLNKLFAYAVLIIVLLGAYTWTILIQIELYSLNIVYNVWYNYYSLPVIGSAVFVLCKNIQLTGLKKIMKQISSCSFGIYLLHVPMLMVVIKRMGDAEHKLIDVLKVTIGVYFVAFLIVWLISRIPYAGRILFLNKE